MTSKYNQKTRDWYSDQGYKIPRVEQYNAHTRQRADFLGIIDFQAVKYGERVIGVQSTSYAGRKKHLDTLLKTQRENSELWLSTGSRLVLISWKKVKVKRGGKAFKYEPIIDEIRLSDLTAKTHAAFAESATQYLGGPSL